jgi:hypothetical protein
MAQAQVQYTPVQVLQAARRAEAEGKMDYALQFYRHIVEHHGASVEAQEAREGLFRIAEWRWGEARVARRQETTGASAPAPQAASQAPAPTQAPTQAPAPAPNSNGNAYQAAANVPQRTAITPVAPVTNSQPTAVYNPPEPADQAVPMTGQTRMPQIIARETAKAEAGEEMVAFKPRYRAGKACAFLVSGSGWITLLVAFAFAALGFGGAQADLSVTGIFGLPLGFVLAVPAVITGLILVIAGYIAVAVFESSNATLEMLSLRKRQ